MELTGTRLVWPIPAFFRARSKAFSSDTGLVALPLVMKNSFGIISRLKFSLVLHASKPVSLIVLRFLWGRPPLRHILIIVVGNE